VDKIRIVLYIVIAFLGFQIYQSWKAEQKTVTTAAEQASAELAQKQIIIDETAPQTESANKQLIKVSTDVLDILIDTQGGNLVQSDLLNYPVEHGSENLIRLQNTSPANFFAAQSGLISSQAAPNHYAVFTTDKLDYQLGDQEEISVPLTWEQDGISVTKTYVFTKGQYLIDVIYTVDNKTDSQWSGNQYRQLQRSYYEDENGGFIYTYAGGVIYDQTDKYQKISLDDIEETDLEKNNDHAWAAMIQHYFVSAWVPAASEKNNYYSKYIDKENKRYILGLTSPKQLIQPGTQGVFATKLYIGPKVQSELEKIAEGLERTVDYGKLTIFSQPLFWTLDKIHGFVGNWGVAIIVLTMLIKLIFYPLSEASYRSMAKMRKATPKMQKIRERYADDRQRQSQALMELYKTEKINPLGGCLPMLIQMPIFIALYWALLESVEIRQAPFYLWIQDLSSNDPYFVLPLIMGATMFIQQKLNPPPPDPMQAKVFMMMPIIFTFFFMMFPAGLVLYWVTNNTLSIIQQYIITKRIENEP